MRDHFRSIVAGALAVLLAGLPSGASGQSADAPAASLVAALQPFVDRHELAGAVFTVATKDRVLAVGSVGFSDVATGQRMTPDALFWIASQSKPMSASALMMLVDDAVVSVDDPVEKYLPEFKGQMVTAEKDEAHMLLKKPSRPIAIRDVLSHTSGLPFSSPVETPTLDALPLRTAVRSYAMLPLQWEPGTRYQYSNAGINTVGRIIEVVSGMAYEEYMQRRLFGPLGMKDTTFWPNDEQTARLAKSYKPDAAKTGLEETTVTQLHYPLSDHAGRFPMPAGGLFSTAADVTRFCRLILGGGELDGRRYLSEESVRKMTSRQTEAGISDSYGFGWTAGGNWAGHGGAYATNMQIDFARGLTLVYMVQHAGFPGAGGKAFDAFKSAALQEFGKR